MLKRLIAKKLGRRIGRSAATGVRSAAQKRALMKAVKASALARSKTVARSGVGRVAAVGVAATTATVAVNAATRRKANNPRNKSMAVAQLNRGTTFARVTARGLGDVAKAKVATTVAVARGDLNPVVGNAMVGAVSLRALARVTTSSAATRGNVNRARANNARSGASQMKEGLQALARNAGTLASYSRATRPLTNYLNNK